MAEGQNKITITVKTPTSKEKITVDENAEIKDVSTVVGWIGIQEIAFGLQP